MKFQLATIVLLLLSVGVAEIAIAETPPETAEHPNIVVILVDDMGYGDAGCFNSNSKIPTPNIDALAAAGMRFTDAHAPGALCHLSRYGLMTGRYPFRATSEKWRIRPSIEPGQATIASLLNAQGYATAMVGKWHLGFDEQGYDRPLKGGPTDVGFKSFFGIRASTDIPPYFYIRGDRAVAAPTDQIEANSSEGWTQIQGEFWRAGGIAPDLELKNVLPRFTEEAIQVIQSHSDSGTQQPLMLYLAYPAPHTPWLPAPEFAGKSEASMYGDFTNMVDANIGKVLTELDRQKMADNTIVIFSSDNGPVWYEADVKRFDHDSSGGLRGMKADAWECGHRMPFIVRWPGRVKPGAVSEHLICFTDLLATFAEIVDVELAADAGPDSFSFLSTLVPPSGNHSHDAWPPRKNLVIAARGVHSVRDGDWKLITGLGSGGFSKPANVKPVPGGPVGQLYNLATDIGETNNLYNEHPEVVKSLRLQLEEVIKSGRSR
ncbi:MAG: arylsulfatase A [Mariniblastus sp.]|jgi:arylsulfatase A